MFKLFLVCILLSVVTLSFGIAWPRYNRNNQNTANVPFELQAVDTPPSFLWQTPLGRLVNAAVIGHNESEIYVTAMFPFTVACIRAEDGVILRSIQFPSDYGSPPTYYFSSISNQPLVFVHSGPNVTALYSNMTILWTYQRVSNTTAIEYTAAPLVSASGSVFVATQRPEGALIALDAETGLVQWEISVDPFGLSAGLALSTDQHTLFVPNSAHSMFAVNVATHTIQWEFSGAGGDFTAPTIFQPLVDSGSAVTGPGQLPAMVIAGNVDGNVYALNLDTGAVLWNYTTSGWLVESVLAVHEQLGYVYAGSHDGNLYCFDPRGNLRWLRPRDQPVFSPSVDGLGRAVVGSDDGTITAYDVDGTVLWTVEMPGFVQAAPILTQSGQLIVCAWRFITVLAPTVIPPALSPQDIAAIVGGGGVFIGLLTAVACVCWRNRRRTYTPVDDADTPSVVEEE